MQKVQSVERAFKILNTLGSAAASMSVMDVAKAVDLPRPTVTRLLQTMQTAAAVERVPGENSYRLGPGIAALTLNLPLARQLTVVAQPSLQALARVTGETIYLSVPDGEQTHYIDQINSRYHIQPIDWIGSRVPMHSVAGGKLFLAYFPAADLERYLAKPLRFFTEKTLRDPDQLREHLLRVHAQGFASTRDEFEEGLVAFAAPILTEPEQILAAVTIAGPSYRFPKNKDSYFIKLVKQTAAEIAHKIRGSTT